MLEGRGADLFMVETFYDLEELVDAIEAVRERLEPARSSRCMTFDEGAETLAGVTAREAAERLAAARRRPRSARTTAPACWRRWPRSRRCAPTASPLAALPNIGLASLAGGRVIYPHATPEYFAEFAAHARELGARVIGGCCGTTPAEIAAIRSAARGGAQAARARSTSRERELVVALGEERRETGARARAARGRVGRLGPARPAARRLERAGCSRSRARSTSPGSPASSTSTTTRPRAPA